MAKVDYQIVAAEFDRKTGVHYATASYEIAGETITQSFAFDAGKSEEDMLAEIEQFGASIDSSSENLLAKHVAVTESE